MSIVNKYLEGYEEVNYDEVIDYVKNNDSIAHSRFIGRKFALHEAIYISSKKTQYKFVKLLLDLKIDPNLPITKPPIGILCNHNVRLDILKLFVDAGLDPNTPIKVYGSSKRLVKHIMQHESEESFEMTKLLVDAGATIEDDDLFCVISMGRDKKDILELLLAKGANINTRDREGNTPLMHAMQNKKTGIVELLIRKGADPFIANKKGKTPFNISLSGSITQLMLTEYQKRAKKQAYSEIMTFLCMSRGEIPNELCADILSKI